MEKVIKVTALEDIRYRVLGSYPRDGFPVKKGQSFLCLERISKLIKVRDENGKRRGKVKYDRQ